MCDEMSWSYAMGHAWKVWASSESNCGIYDEKTQNQPKLKEIFGLAHLHFSVILKSEAEVILPKEEKYFLL